MNKIKYLEFNNKGQLIRVVGVCKAKDFKKAKEENESIKEALKNGN